MEQCHLFLHFGYKQGAPTELCHLGLLSLGRNRMFLRAVSVNVKMIPT